MKVTLFLYSFLFSIACFAQDISFEVLGSVAGNVQAEREMGYEVFPTYKRAINHETLQEVRTLNDVNSGFPSSWIQDYISVEVYATNDGVLKMEVGKSHDLTPAQIELLQKAELGTDISVAVKYHPKHESSENLDAKTINFSYSLIPRVEASFPGGYETLKSYLKSHVVDKIAKVNTQTLDRASVKFTIDEKGSVQNAQISWTSKDKSLDALLLDAITKMSTWSPAIDAEGNPVSQDFEFSVGNMIGC